VLAEVGHSLALWTAAALALAVVVMALLEPR